MKSVTVTYVQADGTTYSTTLSKGAGYDPLAGGLSGFVRIWGGGRSLILPQHRIVSIEFEE